MKWNGERLHVGKKRKEVGTEPIFIRSVPKEDHRRLWTLFIYGTGKTGTGQVSFIHKNSFEPFQFLSEPSQFLSEPVPFFFLSCKRPLIIYTTNTT